MHRRLIYTVLLAVLLAAPTAAGQDWTMENADAPNTGRLDRATPDGLDEVRFVGLGSKVITQPIEGPAGLAIAGTLGGDVVAVDATGEIVWQVDVGGPVRTAQAWTGELIVVVPRSDQALALTPDGQQAWTVPIGNDRQQAGGDEILFVRLASPAIHPSGDLIIADLEGQVQRVNPNGTVDWTWDAPDDQAVEATPAVGPGGHVVVASFTPNQEDEGKLTRLSSAHGKPLWQVEIGAQVVGAPAITGDRVIVPLRDGDAVQSRALVDGGLQWETPFDDSVTVSPTIHDDLAFAGDIRGVTRAMSLDDGSVAWTFNPTDDDTLGQATSGGVLTVADSLAVDGQGRAWVPYWNADMTTCCPPTRSVESPFYILDAATGERLDRTRFDKAAHGPGLHESGVWVGSDEGGLRSWAMPGILRTEASVDGAEVTLATNTDAAGGWTIDWGTGALDEGDDAPPAITTHTYEEAGEHTITVEAGDRRAETTVTITEDAIDRAEDGADADGADDGTDSGSSDDGGAGDGPSTGPDGSQGSTDEPGDEGNGVPLGGLVASVALAAAAWGRRRA